MPPPIPMFFEPLEFGAEVFYTLLIVLLCFFIYFRTKSMYELSRYKGIQYFRNAFLFFGFAHITRFLFYLFILITRAFDLRPLRGLPQYSLVFTTYFSTMAIFSLIYSMTWKGRTHNHFDILANVISVFLALLALIHRSSIIVACSQLLLVVLAFVISLVGKRKDKHISQMKVLYSLILLFWLFNLFIVGPGMLPDEIRITFQAISLAVFMIITYRILKWTK